MIIKFEFNADSPIERREFEVHAKAMEMYFVIQAFKQYLRSKIKYAEQQPSIDEIQHDFINMLKERNILEILE